MHTLPPQASAQADSSAPALRSKDNVIDFVHYKAIKQLLNSSLINLAHHKPDAAARQLQRSRILIDLQDDGTHIDRISGQYLRNKQLALRALLDLASYLLDDVTEVAN